MRELFFPLKIPSVASTCKRGHETKKTCSNRMLHMTCFNAKHLKFYQNSAFHSSLFHFSQLAGIFHPQKQLCLKNVFLTSKNACKEYFFEQKQIKSIAAAYSKL